MPAPVKRDRGSTHLTDNGGQAKLARKKVVLLLGSREQLGNLQVRMCSLTDSIQSLKVVVGAEAPYGSYRVEVGVDTASGIHKGLPHMQRSTVAVVDSDAVKKMRHSVISDGGQKHLYMYKI
jgi:hypothetical protein